MNWECLLDDDDPMDDGLVACDGAEVRAHGAILSVASGVLRRMLSSGMVEGRTKKIELKRLHGH